MWSRPNKPDIAQNHTSPIKAAPPKPFKTGEDQGYKAQDLEWYLIYKPTTQVFDSNKNIEN